MTVALRTRKPKHFIWVTPFTCIVVVVSSHIRWGAAAGSIPRWQTANVSWFGELTAARLEQYKWKACVRTRSLESYFGGWGCSTCMHMCGSVCLTTQENLSIRIPNRVIGNVLCAIFSADTNCVDLIQSYPLQDYNIMCIYELTMGHHSMVVVECIY